MNTEGSRPCRIRNHLRQSKRITVGWGAGESVLRLRKLSSFFSLSVLLFNIIEKQVRMLEALLGE